MNAGSRSRLRTVDGFWFAGVASLQFMGLESSMEAHWRRFGYALVVPKGLVGRSGLWNLTDDGGVIGDHMAFGIYHRGVALHGDLAGDRLYHIEDGLAKVSI